LRILEITQKDIDSLNNLPELPNAQRNRYAQMGLSTQTSNTFVMNEEVGAFFDEIIKDL
jgi:Asp-tRNA(Asn)/Glu-tRNA(Gln) amidotransferase B subunit